MASQEKTFFESKAFKVGMSRVYGLGASVVIVGALFKILHWKGADTMLMVGLLTEAFIFAISAFEPVKHELDWTLVYPELAGMDPKKEKEKKSMTQQLEKMLQEARIEQSMVNRLGDGLRSLSENVSKMATASDAAMATNEYAERVKQASGAVAQLSNSYSKAIDALENMSQSGEVSEKYNEQMHVITDKLSALNSVYEMELQESNNHVRQLNSFYSNLSKAVENLADTEDITRSLREGFITLNQNLSSLNNVYGNMLSAMSGGR